MWPFDGSVWYLTRAVKLYNNGNFPEDTRILGPFCFVTREFHERLKRRERIREEGIYSEAGKARNEGREVVVR